MKGRALFPFRPVTRAPLVLLLILPGAWALAAEELPAVVVTASAIEDSAFSPAPDDARAELEKTPGGVAVVPAGSYLTGRAGTMEDSLRLAPGVFIASRFGADEARLSIRGSGLQRTFHGRGLMVLQDGVPLNLADGSFDMQAIEPQATRYIEVERGANALRYGGSTLGGALNYISETGRTSPLLSLRAEGGSYGYQRYNVAAGAKSGKRDGYATLNFLTQDGFRDHAEQHNWRFFGNAGLQLGAAGETRFYLTAVDTESELPGNLTWAQLQANPRQANARAIARDQHRDFTLNRLANRTLIIHDKASSEVSMYVSQKELFHPIEFFPTGPGLIEQDARDWGLGLRHIRNTRWLGREQEHVVGLQWRHGLMRDERYTYASNSFVPGSGFAVGNTRGTLDHRQQQTADNVDVYGQSSWQLGERTTAVIGLQSTVATRRQAVLADNTGFDPATGAVRLATGSYEETYRRTLPRLGLRYRASDTVEAYGNVSGSFEPPSFSETLNSRPLRAQRAVTTEFGLRGNARNAGLALGWDVSLYRAALRNELLEIALNGGQPATTNAGRAVHQGLEAALSTEADRWRVQTTYLFNDFRFDEDAGFGNNRIAGLPDHVLNAEAACRLPHAIWMGPTLRATSRSFVDHANTTAAPGYTVYGLKLNQKLESGIAWFVEGRNLTDKTHAATTGVVRDFTAAGVNPAQFSPGDGLSVFAGISREF
jgi:iron complex outermembrane receptor protein